MQAETSGPNQESSPNYRLTSNEISVLENELAHKVGEHYHGQENLYALWLGPGSRYADIIRTNEAAFWPTMDEIMEEHENESFFLAMFDTRDGKNKVVHGFRLSRAQLSDDSLETQHDHTGIVLIDDIINSDQGMDTEAFYAYYKERGLNPSKFISVETNKRFVKTDHYNGLSVVDAGYLSIFGYCDRMGITDGTGCIFASLNRNAINSLEGIGVEYEPVAGRPDLKTPVENGQFDDDYTPVAIPGSAKNLKVFRDLQGLAPQAIDLD